MNTASESSTVESASQTFNRLAVETISLARTQLLRWTTDPERMTYSPVLGEKERRCWDEALRISGLPAQSLLKTAVGLLRKVTNSLDNSHALYAQEPQKLRPDQCQKGCAIAWKDNEDRWLWYFGLHHFSLQSLKTKGAQPIVIEIDPATHEAVHALANEGTGGKYSMTPMEVVKKSLALISFVVTRQNEGRLFYIKRTDDPSDVNFYQIEFPELAEISSASPVSIEADGASEKNREPDIDTTNAFAMLHGEFKGKLTALVAQYLRDEAEIIENPRKDL